jgi:hypothetical protein
MIPKYFILIRGDTVDTMTEEALHFAYLFLARALRQHRNESELGNPVEGERHSGLKANTIPVGKRTVFRSPEWRSAWSGMFSTGTGKDEQRDKSL